VVRALAAGASGFLLKDTPPHEIVEAVRRVAAGEPMLSPSVTRQLIQRLQELGTDDRAATARARLADLTERETDVALALARGLSNAEIAAALHLSVPTVKAHISRLFSKLGVTNRVQIAICVHDAGLVRGCALAARSRSSGVGRLRRSFDAGPFRRPKTREERWGSGSRRGHGPEDVPCASPRTSRPHYYHRSSSPRRPWSS
jgi:DNA-binding CsgD family transcriptional regulator